MNHDPEVVAREMMARVQRHPKGLELAFLLDRLAKVMQDYDLDSSLQEEGLKMCLEVVQHKKKWESRN